jgi:hypothetical protein
MMNSMGSGGNPNLGREMSGNARGEGIYVTELAQGDVLELATAHHHYRLVKDHDAYFRISGHPMFCPQPTDVEIEGSFADRWPSIPKPGFIGRGMHLMFKHPDFDLVTTSEIREIHKLH